MAQMTDHDPATCRARIIALKVWPDDPLVGPICDECLDAEIREMAASYNDAESLHE